jgi:hypothetical protein
MALMGILTQEEATAVRAAISRTNKGYAIVANELKFSERTLRAMVGSDNIEPREVKIGLIDNTKQMFPECFNKQNQIEPINTETTTSEPIIKLLNDPSLPQALKLVKLYGNQMRR